MSAVTQLKPKATNLKDSESDFGDGDDGGVVASENISIKPVDNGWIITTFFEDGDEVVEVFDNDGADNGDLQAVQCILESMGLENKIKIK